VVQRVPKAPGIASGILGAGQYGGGILGTAHLRLLVERVSYQAAWTTSGVMVALAAVCVFIGGRALEAAVERSGT
jgi:predicted MFS family arabinose efflux permease